MIKTILERQEAERKRGLIAMDFKDMSLKDLCDFEEIYSPQIGSVARYECVRRLKEKFPMNEQDWKYMR